MNLAVGTLILMGLLSITMGLITEVKGVSILSPYVDTTMGYMMLAIICILLALVVREFEEK